MIGGRQFKASKSISRFGAQHAVKRIAKKEEMPMVAAAGEKAAGAGGILRGADPAPGEGNLGAGAVAGLQCECFLLVNVHILNYCVVLYASSFVSLFGYASEEEERRPNKTGNKANQFIIILRCAGHQNPFYGEAGRGSMGIDLTPVQTRPLPVPVPVPQPEVRLLVVTCPPSVLVLFGVHCIIFDRSPLKENHFPYKNSENHRQKKYTK